MRWFYFCVLITSSLKSTKCISRISQQVHRCSSVLIGTLGWERMKHVKQNLEKRTSLKSFWLWSWHRIIFRWSCLVGWQTWATPVTWTPQCSVCAQCLSSKLHSEGEIIWTLSVFCHKFDHKVFLSLISTKHFHSSMLGIQVLFDHPGQTHRHSTSQQVQA